MDSERETRIVREWLVFLTELPKKLPYDVFPAIWPDEKYRVDRYGEPTEIHSLERAFDRKNPLAFVHRLDRAERRALLQYLQPNAYSLFRRDSVGYHMLLWAWRIAFLPEDYQITDAARWADLQPEVGSYRILAKLSDTEITALLPTVYAQFPDVFYRDGQGDFLEESRRLGEISDRIVQAIFRRASYRPSLDKNVWPLAFQTDEVRAFLQQFMRLVTEVANDEVETGRAQEIYNDLVIALPVSIGTYMLTYLSTLSAFAKFCTDVALSFQFYKCDYDLSYVQNEHWCPGLSVYWQSDFMDDLRPSQRKP